MCVWGGGGGSRHGRRSAKPFSQCQPLLPEYHHPSSLSPLLPLPPSPLPPTQVRLTVGNITTILNTLIYDGKAEMTVVANLRGTEDQEGKEGGTQKLYRAVKPVLQDTGFSRIPCGVCPVSGLCPKVGLFCTLTTRAE